MVNTQSRVVGLVLFVLAATVLLTACGGDDQAQEDARSYTVAALMQNPTYEDVWVAFKDDMAERGYTEADNITYHIETGIDLLELQVKPSAVDVLLVVGGIFGGPEIGALHQGMQWADGDIPLVVVLASGDPVAAGVIESKAEPGGNVTGILITEADAKRFEWFVDMLPPGAERVAVAYDSTSPAATGQLDKIEMLASQAGLELVLLATPPGQPDLYEQAFNTVPEDVDGVFLLEVWHSAFQWCQWAFEHQIPVSQEGYFNQPVPQPMMTYGPSLPAAGRAAARFVDQILQGASPSTLPVDHTELSLMIDLNYAEAIGLELPNSIIGMASEIRRTDLSVFVAAEAEHPVMVSHTAGTGACVAQQISYGGAFPVCVNVACEDLVDSKDLSYEDRTEAGACADTGVVGTCTTRDFTMTFYGGDPMGLSIGCGFMSGTWSTPE